MAPSGLPVSLAAVLALLAPEGTSARQALRAAESPASLRAEDAFAEADAERARWMNGALYRMAQREEGLPPVGPPHDKYGGDRYLVKFPRSFITRIAKLREAGQTRRFNFIGALQDLSAESHYPPGVRDWIVPFVREHFREGDYYQDTNPLPNASRLGAYDRSFDKRNFTKQQRSYENDMVPFDETYFSNLCQSEFTLSPAGDLPYSYRFVEAIFCGSIPIVDQEKYANAEHHQYWAKVKLSKKIGWQFYLADSAPRHKYVYNVTMAAQNFAKAIRYHTFIKGFNDDELCPAEGCAS